MKCPACGIWNRKHYTTCFRCGAPLAGPDAAQEDQPQESTEAQMPVTEEAGAVPEPHLEEARPEPAPDSAPQAEEEGVFSNTMTYIPPALDELSAYADHFSLYDDGDWEEEEDQEKLAHNALDAPAEDAPDEDMPMEDAFPEDMPPDAPVVVRDPESVEPETLREPAVPEEPQTIRTFAPASHREALERVEPLEPPVAEPFVPAGVENLTERQEPGIEETSFSHAPRSVEVLVPAQMKPAKGFSPVDPEISQEILNAINTNPVAHGGLLSPISEPRPRRMMSLDRYSKLHGVEKPAPKPRRRPVKPEPQVNQLDELPSVNRHIVEPPQEPQAAFALHKSVNAHPPVQPLNRPMQDDTPAFSKAPPRDPQAGQGREGARPAATPRRRMAMAEPSGQEEPLTRPPRPPRQEPPRQVRPQQSPSSAPPPPPAPQEPPRAAKEPIWLMEARKNINLTSQPTRSRQPDRQEAAPVRRSFGVDSGTPPAAPRRRDQEEQLPAPPTRRPGSPSTGRNAPRTDRGNITPYPSQREGRASASAPPSRYAPARREPVSGREPVSSRPSSGREPISGRGSSGREPVSSRGDRLAARTPGRVPPSRMSEADRERRRRQFDENYASMRLHSSRTPQQPPPSNRVSMPIRSRRKVRNPARLIVSGVVLLCLAGLLIFGVVKGIGAAVNAISGGPAPSPSPSPAAASDQYSVVPVQVNGHPGRRITFTGEEGDTIFITELSKTVVIAGGLGTLEIEDSELIGDNPMEEDKEVVLHPRRTAAKGGEQTDLPPLTLTITPPNASLEILEPAGGKAETSLSSYQIKIKVDLGSKVTIGSKDVSDMISTNADTAGILTYNITDIQPIGDNVYPIEVSSKGCKTTREDITIYRAKRLYAIELDMDTPTTVETNTVTIKGKVGDGAKVRVDSPIDGEVTQDAEGNFSFKAKLEKRFEENKISIIASKDGVDDEPFIHSVTYNPTEQAYTSRNVWRMDYAELTQHIGQAYLCEGKVVEVLSESPFTCTYNVGTDTDPKIIQLEMWNNKKLELDKKYKVFADVSGETGDGIPILIGRYYTTVQAD